MLSIVIQIQFSIASELNIIGKLTDALKGNDTEKVLSSINEAKELGYQGETIQLLYSIWTGEGQPTGISAALVNKDIVRINVADYLVQAHKNELLELSLDEFQSFSRKVLSGDDVEVISSALFVLAHIDDKEDVKLIEPFIHSKSDYLFRSASLSLAMMCNAMSEKTLISLSEKLDVSRRAYLKDTREKFLSMKEKSFYCQ